MSARWEVRTFGFCAAVTAALLFAPSAGSAIDSADDICTPTTNPCVLSASVDVDDGATLDFGSRTLRLQGSGQIDTNAGTAIVKCGKFEVSTGTSLALKVRGPSGFGTTDGGDLTVEVSRGCSTNTSTRCVKDSECDFGTCSVQVCELDRERECIDGSACNLGSCGATVCSGDFDRFCSNDTTCDIGPCNLTMRRCTKDESVLCFSNAQCNFGPCALGDSRCAGDLRTSCATNGDCDLGACSIDVCSRRNGGPIRECSQDGDCFDGTCSVGDGSAIINGKSRADGVEPGAISIRAAGDITLSQDVNVSSNSGQADGGLFELESGTGSVTVNAAVVAYGGGQAQGGSVSLGAARDVRIDALIDVDGGDFDGGYVDLVAGRDVFINANIEASSTSGGGLGGEVDASADRDLTISGTAAVTTNGHTSADNFGGDGGPQTYVAGRNLNIGAAVKIEADGAMPDGFGEDVFFESGETMTIAGSASARGRGTQGGGGTISADSGGAFNAAAGSVFDVTGGSSGGGAVELFSVGSIMFDGVIDGQTSNGGSPDGVVFFSEADIATTGDVLLSGGPAGMARGDIEIEACRLTLNEGTLLSNLGGAGTTRLIGHERVSVNSGSVVTNAASGVNRLRYRTSAKPPVVLGLVTPAFQLEEDPTLLGCPICGNNEVEGGETCDDGNQTSGDGCSSDCQDEGCVAETPGYPDVPLCDDGAGCTLDVCNAETHSCEHELNCEDGNECTVDVCVNEACVHTKNDSLCDDDNPCTLDICGSFGCSYGLANGPCDDELSCTTGDACSGGECTGTDACPSGQTCSAISGVCEEDAGACGDPTNDGRTTASDALFALNAAVGLQTCSLCTCDVDSSSSVSASDALRLLNFSVGIPGVTLDCPTNC
jgi:hypothetical protein